MDKKWNQKLREARLARNMKPKEAAELLGVTERFYRYLEADQRRPSIKTAVKIEDRFGIKVREMVDDAEHSWNY